MAPSHRTSIVAMYYLPLLSLALICVVQTCVVPFPSFCTTVNWAVLPNITADVVAFSGDLQVELLYVNFEGTRTCRDRYRDLHCRYLYPKCDSDHSEVRPCKSECEALLQDCPGAMLSCNSFPQESCYDYYEVNEEEEEFIAASNSASPREVRHFLTISLALLSIFGIY